MALSDRPSCYSASSAFELMLCWLLCDFMRQQLKYCPAGCAASLSSHPHGCSLRGVQFALHTAIHLLRRWASTIHVCMVVLPAALQGVQSAGTATLCPGEE